MTTFSFQSGSGANRYDFELELEWNEELPPALLFVDDEAFERCGDVIERKGDLERWPYTKISSSFGIVMKQLNEKQRWQAKTIKIVELPDIFNNRE